MKMSWSPEGGLQFSVFKKRGLQLKYVIILSNHTPDYLRAIPLGVLNCLVKITSQKPSLHSERVDKIYPHHASALRAAGLAPLIFRTMRELWKNQDEKIDIEN